jgi:amino acid transporter
VLGLDTLASTAYGPEAALVVLMPLGVAGLQYVPIVLGVVVFQLTMLALSYRQTTAAYPNGAGAYAVAKDNLGERSAVCAGVALLLDYLLNVAVGIAAGVGALVSAIPPLHPYTLPLTLLVLATLVVLNLRGVRESGLVFAAPVMLFIGCLAIAMVIGIVRVVASGGDPHPVAAPPAEPPSATSPSTWLLLTAFANGCTALTGVEATSNGVPLFRPPTVKNAIRTLTLIAIVLAAFLISLAVLIPHYKLVGMDETKDGYQTILSQLVGAVTGRGVFYYIALTSIFLVLTYSAQTSFAGFPRVCRMLAEDRFLPPSFSRRGRRLVFSWGIVVLAVLGAGLLIAFHGITTRLIPLFAIGAFSAFLFSQVGMVIHWRRHPGKGVRKKLVANAIGACSTAIVLGIIIVAKFTEGAWMVLLVAPPIVYVLLRIRRHYDRLASQVQDPLELTTTKLRPPVVLVPIESWNRVAERGIRLGLQLSDDVTAVHVKTEHDHDLNAIWAEKVEEPAREAGLAIPRLVIVESEYREVGKPLLAFIDEVKREKPDRAIAVMIPEVIEPYWYEYLLHEMHGRSLRAELSKQRDGRTIVIHVPWYLDDD